jgi:archaellum biogenesis protein FlaJ (TadC family)
MVNYLAVFVTAIVGYVIGMLWYSPALFGKQWMKLSGVSKKDADKKKKEGMAGTMVAAFVAVLLMSYVLAYILGLLGAATFWIGVSVGFWIWLGFLATTQINIVFWQNKPFTLYLLNTAHYLVALAVMGGILAVWV